MSDIQSQLRDYYGLDDAEFNERIAAPEVSGLPNPFLLWPQFESMIDRLRQLIAAGRKIVVYGDYDVDGLTSTAILVGTLRRLGAEIGYYIPSRYLDGYGLSPDRVKQFAAKGYQVIITVDNGISENKTVALAKELGFEVFIVDHHEVTKAQLPVADYIFHQYICNLTDYNISAAFLALLVSYGLLGSFDDYFVTLAGLAVFSDSMPLIGANLLLARLSLKNLNAFRYPPLWSLLGFPSGAVGADDYNFTLIPALNAVGRIDKTMWANNIIKFFLSSDPDEIRRLADKIRLANELRKQTVKEFDDRSLYDSASAVIYGHVDLPLGLIGLIANKVMNKSGRPTVLFTEDPQDPTLLVGSIRTPAGYKTAEVLKENCPFLSRFGGHAEAAGFTLAQQDVGIFRETLEKFLLPPSSAAKQRPYMTINFETIITDYPLIEAFGPYGNGFEKPRFACELYGEQLQFSRDGKHLLTPIGGLKVVSFNTEAARFGSDGCYRFIGTLGQSSFRGQKTLDLHVEEILEVSPAEA